MELSCVSYWIVTRQNQKRNTFYFDVKIDDAHVHAFYLPILWNIISYETYSLYVSVPVVKDLKIEMKIKVTP